MHDSACAASVQKEWDKTAVNQLIVARFLFYHTMYAQLRGILNRTGRGGSDTITVTGLHVSEQGPKS